MSESNPPVSTGRGDDGTTTLLGAGRMGKDDLRIIVVGDVDEDEIRAKYEREGNPYYSTARLWDDGIIDPLETRRVLGMCLSVTAHAPVAEPRYGVFRM